MKDTSGGLIFKLIISSGIKMLTTFNYISKERRKKQ